MISPKRNKSLKFNRVGKHNFKFAKRLSINKSINDSNNNFIYDRTPNNKKEKRKRSQINSVLNVCKNIDENYSLAKNREPLKTMKKLHSTNKIQMIKFKNIILRQKSFRKKEEQKNETDNQLPIILKLDQKNKDEKKKFISSNNIAHIFLKKFSKDLFKTNNRKSKIKINNDFENENTNYDINNIVKVKKKKKESKENIDNKEILEYRHKNKKEHKDKKEHKNKKENPENKTKIEDKEDKEDKKSKLNEEKGEDEKDKNLKNKVKCKFFCCL